MTREKRTLVPMTATCPPTQGLLDLRGPHGRALRSLADEQGFSASDDPAVAWFEGAEDMARMMLADPERAGAFSRALLHEPRYRGEHAPFAYEVRGGRWLLDQLFELLVREQQERSS